MAGKRKKGNGSDISVGDWIRSQLVNIGPWFARVSEVSDTHVTVTHEYHDGKCSVSLQRADYCAKCDLWDQFYPGHEGPHQHVEVG